MKNDCKFLIAILTVVLVILAACGDSSDESSAALDGPSHANQNTNADSSNVDSKANDSIDNTNTGNLKEEYLKKLNDAKKEMKASRKEVEGKTTYAMKKIEGDRYDVWDGLLNEIYGVLKKQLSAEEMDQLRKEQRKWLDDRDDTAKEASLKYKGGTMEQLEYVMVRNNLTKERCFELVEDYLK
ncbi:DUF1311 domain-containing protein [Lentibacillus cibarius]|uniref:DUF1311 domain-containing protein n=1 Tax=Lentibacillus cibarius TaxID=2583219 RepID=A0A549YJF0_9BACI|nr:lysozyme inhibitor LprI family protein [Lentibacillus cibarius]TRM12008.1 DUF1311 domain-containing protein [Lentibacillus cibarius]